MHFNYLWKWLENEQIVKYSHFHFLIKTNHERREGAPELLHSPTKREAGNVIFDQVWNLLDIVFSEFLLSDPLPQHLSPSVCWSGAGNGDVCLQDSSRQAPKAGGSQISGRIKTDSIRNLWSVFTFVFASAPAWLLSLWFESSSRCQPVHPQWDGI